MRPMRGDCMICMEMYLNGAGIGGAVIWGLRRRPIPWARLRGLAAWCAAAVGATTRGSRVPRTGTTALRAAAAATLASALCALKGEEVISC